MRRNEVSSVLFGHCVSFLRPESIPEFLHVAGEDIPISVVGEQMVRLQRFCLIHPAPSHTLHIMTSLLQTGLNGHLPAPPEKRFLISNAF